MSEPVSDYSFSETFSISSFRTRSLSPSFRTISVQPKYILCLVLLLFYPEHSLDACVSFIDDDDELGRVRMIRGLCPDVSNGRDYCKSFAVPSTGREIKSIQTIIPQSISPLIGNKTDSSGVIETLNIFPRVSIFLPHTFDHKYLFCGDFVACLT